MSNIKGKVAVVTGASKGIGAAIAKSLAAEGASVVVNYAGSKDAAERVVADIKAKGGQAIAVQANVAKEADVKRLFDETKKTYGRVDVLVNNAGVYAFQPLADATAEEFHREFDINVLGTILAAREAANHIGKDGGSIVNVSSVVATKGLPQIAIYSATKGAVDALTRALAVELAPRNIRVNTIAPGAIDTEGFAAVGLKGSDMEKQMVADTPLGRLGVPEDIARVAVFLASDQSRWVTGQQIIASGGVQ